MNIIFATSELSPYATTGGLGDISSQFPTTLREIGHSVSIAVPLYPNIRKIKGLKKSSIILDIPMGGLNYKVSVWTGKTDKDVSIFAIQKDECFDRSNLYGNEDGDFYDNAFRYILFSKAVVELGRYLDPHPEIIHCNDWQTGLIPAFVKSKGLPYRTVFTIHNLAYQGSFHGFDFDLTNLPGDYFSPSGVEFYGNLNCMKAGIRLADAVATVSPTYAKEIQTEEFGCGLHVVLAEQSYKLTGIINGIDTDRWNPAKDSNIHTNYTSKKMAGKKACKEALLKSFRFKEGADIPLFACVSRLVPQKGFDLLVEIMDEFLDTGSRLVLLGSGEERYEEYFRQLTKKRPNQVKVKIGFDEKLAHKIEAGADFFLMPSSFEPCGLNQLYSQRYGTIPIVHRTGGLADTVVDWDPNTEKGNGFVFSPYRGGNFLDAINRGLELQKKKKLWNKIRKNAMEKDFSWGTSSQAYEKLYQDVLTK